MSFSATILSTLMNIRIFDSDPH